MIYYNGGVCYILLKEGKYGKRYCPCSLVRNDDTVCMCKDESIQG